MPFCAETRHSLPWPVRESCRVVLAQNGQSEVQLICRPVELMGPNESKSRANGSVMPAMAALLAEYEIPPGAPSRPSTLDTLTIRPRWPSESGGFCAMIGANSRMMLNAPTVLTYHGEHLDQQTQKYGASFFSSQTSISQSLSKSRDFMVFLLSCLHPLPHVPCHVIYNIVLADL